METYEIRQVDALLYEENDWIYNTTYHIGKFKTAAKDVKRSFLRALHKLGIKCNRGKCRVIYDGDVYEVQDRKTLEPLFVAIPMEV